MYIPGLSLFHCCLLLFHSLEVEKKSPDSGRPYNSVLLLMLEVNIFNEFQFA